MFRFGALAQAPAVTTSNELLYSSVILTLAVGLPPIATAAILVPHPGAYLAVASETGEVAQLVPS